MHMPAWARSNWAGALASIVAVALVTGLIELFNDWVPVLSLGVLYLFAVLPIAIGWGVAFAVPVAVASMAALNWFFLPPIHTFTLADRSNWFALAVYLFTAVVVSELAARARQRAAEAEQREREAALLADVASDLLLGGSLEAEIPTVAARTADVLGTSSARIELGERTRAEPGESPHDLLVGDKRVGTIYLPEREEPPISVCRRVLPALASLLAVGSEREHLSREAVETEALRRSDAMKTAVIQAVSHDLRTPLATIEAALDGLEGDLVVEPADRTGLFETIRMEHTRLKRLVDNLLDLSRLQAGAAQPTPEVWTSEDLIDQALHELGDPERVDVGRGETHAVRVDALQIQRALVNLLENALKFSGPDGSVHVRVTATRSEVIIRVTDQGPGVPAEQQEQIFEPFQRVSGASDHHGAGLGLAIARGFAEANGGRIWVESRAGQGASFALALPLADSPVPAQQTPA